MVLLTSLLAEIPAPVHATVSREITITKKKSRVELENETDVVQNRSYSCYKRDESCCEGRNTKCKGLLISENMPLATEKACYCDDSCTLLKGLSNFVIFFLWNNDIPKKSIDELTILVDYIYFNRSLVRRPSY